MQEIASKRYATALFEAAVEEKNVDLYLGQLKLISDVFSENKDLQVFLNHPTISIEEKTSVMGNIFKGNVSEEILKLINLLIKHGRIMELNVVYKDFEGLVMNYKGIKIAYATTAVKMTDSEIKALEEKLSAKYGLKVEVKNLIDESIIGGVSLKVDDEIFDGTVKGSLEKIQKQVMKQGGEVRA